MIDLTPAAKNARLAGLRDLIDTGTGIAAIQLYAAPRPSIGASTSATLIAAVELPVPSGAIVDGVLTLDTAEWVNVLASGDIHWARIVDANGLPVADMGVGLTGSGADLEINTLTVFSGGLLRVDAAILSE